MIDGLIDGYFDFLEKEGKIKIGDYVVFRDMFEFVDCIVFDEIDKVLVDIKRVL